MTREVSPTMNNAWIWLDQQTSVDNYPKITNFKGTQISIAPRRYIVQLETRLSAEELENKLDEITRESSFKKSVSSIHNYSAAREPLHTCTSHFQILQVETNIYLMLNNISSQSIRSTLIEQTLEHLWTSKIPYSIGLIWIQTGHENATPRCYKVQMKWEVIEVITKAINHTHEYIVDETKYVKPWTLTAWVAMNHVCKALENEPEVNPNLLQVNQTQKRKGPETNQVPAKKKLPPWMQKNTGPSSSTSNTNHPTGRQNEQKDNNPTSSASTTETTTTSSSNVPTTETSNEAERELPNSLVAISKELQRQLLHAPRLNYLSTSFCIASVTVSEASINMELKLCP
uniref:Nonstructural protein 2 n=1 Tax=Soybean thrips denso-like virus 1 TaxID=2802959 RepID=A0A7T8G240_9VIRU|nr:nonstructural protein 2 [Soybean thrips denso-like virus 1]